MKRIIIICALVLSAWMPASSVHAVELLPACARGNGDCSTCEILQLFHNASQKATELFSAVLLFTLVFGGFWWLISGGSQERVKKGTQVITGSLIGLVFVLTGYMMVNLIISGFVGGEVGSSTEKGTDMTARLFKGLNNSGDRWDTICDVKLPTPSATITDSGTNVECISTDTCPAVGMECVDGICIWPCEKAGFYCLGKDSNGDDELCGGTERSELQCADGEFCCQE